MLGLPRLGVPAWSRTTADAERTNEEELGVLRRRTAWLAVLPAVGVDASIVGGTGASGLLWLPVFLLAFAVVLWVNFRAVARGRARGLFVPRPRVLFSVAMAVLVAYSTPSWMYGEEIDKARGAKAAQDWHANSDRLGAELAKVEEIANRDVAQVDSDQFVQHLTGRLTELRTKAAAAEGDSKCEQNETCGLGEEVEKLEGWLRSVRITVLQRVHRTARERDSARSALPRIRTEIEALGPDAPAVVDRISGLMSFGQKEKASAALATIVAFALCLLADLTAFFLVVKGARWRKGKKSDYVGKFADTTATQDKGHVLNARPGYAYNQRRDEE
ncbi:MAG TPA: hypothetical protein VNO31_16795 [Umezawaea sp.]|nr:hypothetical protein [Umezawaea sp.]